MIKYAIKYYESENETHLIFHASPHASPFDPKILKEDVQFNWQWYVLDSKSKSPIKLENEVFESFGTSTELIKELDYEGKSIFCIYTDLKTKEVFKSEEIILHSNFRKMELENSKFDKISEYDKAGMII